MLRITVPGPEVFDNSKDEFDTVGGTVLELEHSLVSLSKWESIYEKPFLDAKDLSPDELMGYIQCMVLTPDVPEEIFYRLSAENFTAISDYMNAKMTATWFSERPGSSSAHREIITAELIYYSMTALNIDFACERWHLNRLLTLIRVCSEKQSPPQKMSRAEIAERNRRLNAERRKKLGTQG